MIYYYSAEGNSRHIAELLGKLLGDKVADVRSSNVETTCTSERIGFVFPVHCWGVPPVMHEFIERLSVQSDSPYVWAVMTCGDDTGMADNMLAHCLHKSGLNLNAAFSVTMPNTYLLMKGFKLDSLEVVDEKLRRSEDRVKMIADCIMQKRSLTDLHRGSFPWFKTKVIYPFFFRRKIKADKWHVDTSKCTRCGLCVRNCPTANIVASQNGTPMWNDKCIQCLACYHNCPVRAIDCLPYTHGSGQYTYSLK